MTQTLKQLLTTRLTRREFLVYAGGVLIGLLGLPSILKLVSTVKSHPRPRQITRSLRRSRIRAFGEGPYGV